MRGFQCYALMLSNWFLQSFHKNKPKTTLSRGLDPNYLKYHRRGALLFLGAPCVHRLILHFQLPQILKVYLLWQ